MKKITIGPGERYGRWTVLAAAGSSKNGRRLFRCRCECGTEHAAQADHLKHGRSRSCGCLSREVTGKRATTHGHTVGRRPIVEYTAWCAMIQRCTNSNRDDYKHYGGRGIKVCERWRKSFAAFLADMGERPGPDYSLDRKENDGNYEPDNVRWATQAKQGRNRRSNKMVLYGGRRMPLVEACEIAGIKYDNVRTRLRLGWTVERALTPIEAEQGHSY